GQRIDLVHELRQLRASEEVADDRRESLRVYQLLRRDRVDALIVEGHALADEALGAGQAEAALVGKELADGADAAAAQVVDVVQVALAALEADEVFGRLHDV